MLLTCPRGSPRPLHTHRRRGVEDHRRIRIVPHRRVVEHRMHLVRAEVEEE